MNILLDINPSAATYSNPHSGVSLLHRVGQLINPVCARNIMKILLVHFPLGLEVHARNGIYLPLQCAINYSIVEVVQFISVSDVP